MVVMKCRALVKRVVFAALLRVGILAGCTYLVFG
jgi:hypothetical protein